MRDANPGWTVIRYTNFEEADPVQNFDELQIQAKTDWLRICLIERYGGVWLDSSIICNRGIEETIDVSEDRVVGFECPIGTGILENWAFGARPNHPLIQDWRDEFKYAIEMGFDAYKQASSTVLNTNDIYDHMPYLTMHGAFVIVRERHPGSVAMIHSMDDHHGPFRFTRDEWRRGSRPLAVYKLFLWDFEYPPLLKLTGETRRYAEDALTFLPTLTHSFIYRTLRIRGSCDTVYAVVFTVTITAIILSTLRRRHANARRLQ